MAQPARQTGDGDVRDMKDEQEVKSSRDKEQLLPCISPEHLHLVSSYSITLSTQFKLKEPSAGIQIKLNQIESNFICIAQNYNLHISHWA